VPVFLVGGDAPPQPSRSAHSPWGCVFCVAFICSADVFSVGDVAHTTFPLRGGNSHPPVRPCRARFPQTDLAFRAGRTKPLAFAVRDTRGLSERARVYLPRLDWRAPSFSRAGSGGLKTGSSPSRIWSLDDLFARFSLVGLSGSVVFFVSSYHLFCSSAASDFSLDSHLREGLYGGKGPPLRFATTRSTLCSSVTVAVDAPWSPPAGVFPRPFFRCGFCIPSLSFMVRRRGYFFFAAYLVGFRLCSELFAFFDADPQSNPFRSLSLS